MEKFNLNQNENKKHQVKKILSDRAFCDHIKEEDNFNLNNYMINDYFNVNKIKEISHKIKLNNFKERERINKILQKVLPYIQKEGEHLNKDSSNSGSTSAIKTETTNKNNKESLYSLITSEFFQMDKIIIYLDQKEESSILDTLINLIYEKYLNQSFFYLPQLCSMLNYKNYIESLEGYLLDRCCNQIKFSLQITWIANSYIEDYKSLLSESSNSSKNEASNCNTKNIFSIFLQKVEESLVNGNRPTLSQYVHYDQLNMNFINDTNISDIVNEVKETDKLDSIYNDSMKKEIRLDYFNTCMNFYQRLKDMCEDLKNYDKVSKTEGTMNRKEALMSYINDFNDYFITLREEHSDFAKEFCFYYGIILPFDDTVNTSDMENNIIVRLIPNDSFCFSTKARVPTKLCAECIRMEECKSWDTLYIDTVLKKCKRSLSDCKIAKRMSDVGKTFSRKSIDDEIQKNINNVKLKEFYDDINKEFMIYNKSSKLLLNIFNITPTKEAQDKEKETTSIDTTSQNNTNNPSSAYEQNSIFGQPLTEKIQEIKSNSPFRKFKSYTIKNFIAKANDDLRQELLCIQLIKKFDEIFKKSNSSLKLHPYEILITSSSSGLIEFLSNSNSIDGIKKQMKKEDNYNLNNFYRNYFADDFDDAQRNFIESLAGYSLICYYIQIKDRHNGNIMIDMYGNIIHIDYGFILGISPGNLNFESAPFKLTKEYIEIMDGEESQMFEYFKSLLIKGMIECKKHVESLVKIVEIMSHNSSMPCFVNKDSEGVVKRFRERFMENVNDWEFTKIVEDLVGKAKDNFWTNKYDYFQKITNGIIP